MVRIKIQVELCRKCGMCVEICPEALFVQKTPGSVPCIPRQRSCISCGHCVSVCRTAAIIHPDFPVDERYRQEN